MNPYLEALILGLTQGITEWLPVSSEAMIVLLRENFLSGETSSLYDSISYAIFLHLGTTLSAIIYFRNDLWRLIKSLGLLVSSYFKKSIQRQENAEQKKVRKILWFLIVTTLISGAIGYLLLQGVKVYEEALMGIGVYINFIIAGLLVITGILQIVRKNEAQKAIRTEATKKDAIITGIAQGITPLPGISRSGTTTAALLLLGIREDEALKLSFLASIPLVIGANIVLGLLETGIVFSGPLFLALAVSAIIGYVTIDFFLRLAKKVNFGWFVIIFAILLVIATVFV